MKPFIRHIGLADFEECARIIRESFQIVAEEFGFTIQNNPTNGAFIRSEKLAEDFAKGISMFGIYEDTSQVGFVALEKKDEGLYYLEKLAVLPQYRHCGYGSLLLNHGKNYVKKHGGTRISIAIIDENIKLKNWYREYGFEEMGVKKFEYLTFMVYFMALTI